MRKLSLVLEYKTGLPINDVTRGKVVPVYDHRTTSELKDYKGKKKLYPVFLGTALKKFDVNHSVVSLKGIKTIERATEILKIRNTKGNIKKATYTEGNGFSHVLFEMN